MIEQYGADAVRLFILSDSPPEKDIQWSESGMSSSYKFIQKFWSMSVDIIKLLQIKLSNWFNKEIDIFTNQALKKVNTSLEKFRYNVIIAVFHEIFNFYSKILNKKQNFENLEENFKKILIIFIQVIPHLTNECLTLMNVKVNQPGHL